MNLENFEQNTLVEVVSVERMAYHLSKKTCSMLHHSVTHFDQVQQLTHHMDSLPLMNKIRVGHR